MLNVDEFFSDFEGTDVSPGKTDYLYYISKEKRREREEKKGGEKKRGEKKRKEEKRREKTREDSMSEPETCRIHPEAKHLSRT